MHPVGQVLSNMVCNKGSDNSERSGDVPDALREQCPECPLVLGAHLVCSKSISSISYRRYLGCALCCMVCSKMWLETFKISAPVIQTKTLIQRQDSWVNM